MCVGALSCRALVKCPGELKSMWLLESCPNSGIWGKQWPLTGRSFLPHGPCLYRPAVASTQECMSDSSTSPHPFLHLYRPVRKPNNVKQIPTEERYSVYNIWFVKRPKESYYELLINDSVSKPVKYDEWLAENAGLIFVWGLLKYDTRSRLAFKRYRRHLQAKTNDRDRLCFSSLRLHYSSIKWVWQCKQTEFNCY